MDSIQTLIIPIVTLVIGVILGRYLLTQLFKGQQIAAENKAQQVVKEAELKAESTRKDKELQAKERFLQLKTEHDLEMNKRNQTMATRENQLKQKEQSITSKIDNVTQKETELANQIEATKKQQEVLNSKKADIDKAHLEHVAKLEKIAGLTAEEAKNQLVETLREDAKSKASGMIKEVIDEAKLNANKEAKKIVIQAIQRTATEQAIENAVTVFNIKNDEVKGQIIGREGRNIRAFEAATGVEVIVDDTPEAIVLSCFDPLRREIARLALHRLVQDGRIHPARIEEVVNKTRTQIEEEIMEIGERTCIDLGIHGLSNELIRLVGKMRYRSSYGQNLLQHSREVANLCAVMASELGLNAKLAKRAGLLHDIGKVTDENPELPHAILGMKLAEKYKENPIICNAIGAHHDEIEMTDPISAIVQACDSISGARPGARREIVESYIKRLKELETIASSYPGVEKAFAIQAGRELRVIVESDKVTDDNADQMSMDISTQIQTSMQYPGQIKVTVIREKRSISYAK